MVAYVLINYNDCAKRVNFSANTVVLRPLVKTTTAWNGGIIILPIKENLPRL